MVSLIDPVGGEAESLVPFPIASPYPVPVGDPNRINRRLHPQQIQSQR